MDTPIYLNEIKYKILPEQAGKIPRERYRQYLNDLYKVYRGSVSEETFHEGAQYSYAELGEALFDKMEQQTLKQLDTIIVAHWSQEFDPDYASCGPYFLHKYGLTADIFDVCDQGTLAPFTALKLLILAQQQQQSMNGMVLCLEQTTIPRDKSQGDPISIESGALGIFISNALLTQVSFSVLLKAVDIIPEGTFLGKINIFADYLKELINNYCNDLKKLKFVVRKGTTIWKLLNHYQLRKALEIKEDQFEFIEPKLGCLSAFKKLSSLFQQDNSHQIYLLLDEDVESLNMGYLFVEKSYG
jgi:hypothetical protein